MILSYKKERGLDGFSKEYWDKNYSEPEDMDNIGNSPQHVRYMQSIFHLEQIEINSIIDFGFGLGHLFSNAINVFNPKRAMGLEPSKHAFLQSSKVISRPEETKKFKLIQSDLVNYLKNLSEKDKAFDLGICTSVFQYLSDEEIKFALPIMSRHVRYLYFSVPTDFEFKRQIEEYDFIDEFAIHRPKEKYLKWIRPHFTFVSSRLLESKYFFNDANTEFREQLFRF